MKSPRLSDALMTSSQAAYKGLSSLSATNLIRVGSPLTTSKVTLICLAHAGAGSSTFRGWAEELRPHFDVVTIQLPGREDRIREPAYETMEAAVAPIVAAIEPFLNRPFVVLGHSLGALIAFEVVHRIRQVYASEPIAFIPSACRAPYFPHPVLPISHLPDADFVTSFQARYDGIPSVILNDPAYLQAFLFPLRADFRILEAHQFTARPLLTCPLLIFGGDRDEIVAQEALEGWKTLSTGTCQMNLLEAGHLYLQTHRKQMTHLLRRQVLSILDQS